MLAELSSSAGRVESRPVKSAWVTLVGLFEALFSGRYSSIPQLDTQGFLCMRMYPVLLFPSRISSPRWSLFVTFPGVWLLLLGFDPILRNSTLRKNFWPILTSPHSGQPGSAQTMPWAFPGPRPAPECSSIAAVVPRCSHQRPWLHLCLPVSLSSCAAVLYKHMSELNSAHDSTPMCMNM